LEKTEIKRPHRRVTVSLKENLYKQFKLKCARKGSKVSEVLGELVEAYCQGVKVTIKKEI
jgi:metal-responsive CopG/Arc/MetJ family transcriptional regulator